MVGKKENIHIEVDYQNIILIDPNKVVDGEGNVSERLLHHEELVFFANLECILYPRTRLAISSDGNLQNQTVSLASINFVKPNDTQFLNNEYLNEITGFNSIFGKGDNQIKINKNEINKPDQSKEYYFAQTNLNKIDNNLLLISSIEIKTNSSLMPTVRIEMIDVRGRALFELGENSPYAAFFNYPYPLFYLTFKGYLGKAVKYQLALQTFNARFESESGNFLITCEFYAYKFNILTQLSMTYALSVPYMYQTTYQTKTLQSANSQSAQNQIGNTNTDVNELIVTKGYEKVKELYSEYKSKGLIPDDFPEITILELINKLDVLLKTLTKDTLTDLDWQPITDGENYSRDLSNFERDIYFARGDSWKDIYLDSENYLIDADTKEKIFTYKKEIVEGGRKLEAKTELTSIIGKYKNKLNENSTFGEKGKTPITFAVDEYCIKKELKPENIDFYETYRRRTGKEPVIDINNATSGPTAEFLAFQSKEFDTQLDSVKLNENQEIVYEFYTFQGDKRFLDQTQIMRTKLSDLLKKVEEEIQKKLSEKIKSKEPMGFKPTIRNVLAVIMANTEAFLRIMCDVHKTAWDLSNNNERVKAILGDEKSSISSDGKKSTQTTDGVLTPIYPWPQFYVPTGKAKGEKYHLEYPGNPNQISKTKGNRPEIWPEVEFVEEYFKGMSLTKFENPTKLYGELNNDSQHVDRISLNAIDFPTTNVIFRNRQEVKFIFEIWERLFLYANYQRFNRPNAQIDIIDILADCEFKNLTNALGVDSPSLTKILKNYALRSSNIVDVMRMASNNGTGESWQKFIRDEFVTPYINNEVNNSSIVYFEKEINSNVLVVNPVPDNFPDFITYIKDSITNTTDILDTFPFVINEWVKGNMAEGNSTDLSSLYDTSKTYVVYDNKKMISNFNETTTKLQVRPITNFNFMTPDLKQYPSVSLFKANFEEKYNDLKKLQVTEGRLTYYDYSGNTTSNQITSLLNTPYFINAIIEGVQRWQNKVDNPFVSAAFLFLNSLPVASLKEKYKTYDNGATSDLDYIFSSFKKFGAIHRLPYAFILKYGSIWHRYKTWINTNIDILDNVWKDFDYVGGYDPINFDSAKSYNVNLFDGIGPTTIVLKENSTIGINNSIEMNLGFYPGLINSFSLFVKGTPMFSDYSDTTIQLQLADFINGFNLFKSTDAKINKINYDPDNLTNILSLNTWNCTINDYFNNAEFIVPSFGSSVNQILGECFDDNGKLIQDVENNPAVYNGSVRLIWGLPNFGYFDTTRINKPDPKQYFKTIFSASSQQESFSLGDAKDNSYIDELLSVFNKETLDKFETEFLSFSKSIYEYKTEISDGVEIQKVKIAGLDVDTDVTFKNFQVLMRSILSVQTESINKTNSTLRVSSTASKQFENLTNTIKKFLDFDVIVKIGNPGDFNRKLMDSFANNRIVADAPSFGGYVPNSLPNSNTGSINVQSSKIQNPDAWNALYTYVGFSNVDGIRYSDTGSTITDFFIDNNIEFSENSVKTYAPIIKIYATQKKLNSSINGQQFSQLVTNFLNLNQSFTDTLSNIFFSQVNTKLPTVTEKKELNIDPILDGDQTKVSMWERFKALNDTWIAGYDYSQTTLLEDILIIDRASRNIADEAYIDPFVITGILNKTLNQDMSIYVYLETILRDHHFIPMMHPGYINFYNIQKVSTGAQPRVEEHMEFGNNLFGTFLNVDTRDSSPKLVCTFAAAGSKYPNMGSNQTFMFNDDSMDFNNSARCPLIEEIDGKTDYGLSNRVVGFNVDIGIRNQNVFYYFDVSQELGQMTAEAILATQSMVNQYSGRKVATQNVSLWNFYQNRSYSCKVNCIGNAMIQPTMYFNLRHVPMFNGPYLIQDVTHSIKPGKFETSFTGTRQQMFALPDLEDYIQVLTKKLYIDLVQKLKTQVNTNAQDVANSTQNTAAVTTAAPAIASSVISNTGKVGISSNCSDKLDVSYNTYIPADTTKQTYLSEKELADGLIAVMVGSSDVSKGLSFLTIYMESSSNGQITKFNNNYAGVRLDYKWLGQLSTFFANNYYCNMGADGYYYPYASFDTPENLYQFLKGKWDPIADGYQLTADSLLEAWIKSWNRNTMSDTDFLIYKTTNPIQYQNLLFKATEAFNKAKILGIIS